jgi:hypothetical protein
MYVSAGKRKYNMTRTSAGFNSALIIQAQYQIHVFDLNALVDFQVT